MRPLIVVLTIMTLCAGVEAAEPLYEGKTVSEWTAQLGNIEPDLREEAIAAFVKIGPAAAVPALIEALKDDDLLVRLDAALALLAIEPMWK